MQARQHPRLMQRPRRLSKISGARWIHQTASKQFSCTARTPAMQGPHPRRRSQPRRQSSVTERPVRQRGRAPSRPCLQTSTRRSALACCRCRLRSKAPVSSAPHRVFKRIQFASAEVHVGCAEPQRGQARQGEPARGACGARQNPCVPDGRHAGRAHAAAYSSSCTDVFAHPFALIGVWSTRGARQLRLCNPASRLLLHACVWPQPGSAQNMHRPSPMP